MTENWRTVRPPPQFITGIETFCNQKKKEDEIKKKIATRFFLEDLDTASSHSNRFESFLLLFFSDTRSWTQSSSGVAGERDPTQGINFQPNNPKLTT